MSAKVNNKYGCIEIDKQVIAQIVYRAAMESYGLVGFSQKIKGIVELLKEGLPSLPSISTKWMRRNS